TLVVSPLIALMQDQVAALQELGVKADTMNSGTSAESRRQILSSIADGSLKMLYMAPESLMQEDFVNYLSGMQISLIAVDEAHCISVWGNDFRPEYTKLSYFKNRFPEIPMIALTATADAATQSDILSQLGLDGARRFLSSFERKNLTIRAAPGQDRWGQILRFLYNHKQHSGIVYCLSRKGTETVAAKLKDAGYNASYYHAGMDATSRALVQRRFQNDEVQIICATIAFGMGIDKSNVRFVIHYNLPKNIEGYYQEIGRAGRDGSESECLLFYSWRDKSQLQTFIVESPMDASFKEVQSAKLDRMWEFASASSCRTNLILNYFGEFRKEPCGHCDNCLHPPKVFDGTVIAQKALSAVIRSNQEVGIDLLIDILRGSNKEEVRQGRYDQIKTYGAGRDLPYLDWKSYITQILNKGLLRIDYTDRSTLKVTPLTKQVLSGDVSVELVKFSKTKTVTKIKIDKSGDSHSPLFQSLRRWRYAESQKRGVPAYTIFNDATLRAIVDQEPLIPEDLLMVEGIGEAKLGRYGNAILNVVNEYYKSK
ncbi:MAG: DNA helicase RecQ, partial [Bacteroidota bacterium]